MTSRPYNPPPLQRNSRNGYIGGVCAGLADRLMVDVAWIRGAFVLVSIFGGDYRGWPLVAYVVLWIAMPRVPESDASSPAGLRDILLGLLATGVLLTLIAIGEAGRLGTGVVLAPAAVAFAGALVRRDRLSVKLALLAAGLAVSLTLLTLNNRPTFGDRSITPSSANAVASLRPSIAFGDLTIDLQTLQNNSGTMHLPILAISSDVTLIVPDNVSVWRAGTRALLHPATVEPPLQEMRLTLDLDGTFNSLEIRGQ